MNVKLTTGGAIVAAAMVLVPYNDASRAIRVTPASPATVAPETAVGRIIAAQGNAALVQIRADVTKPLPPDLSQVAVEGRPE